MSYSSINQHPTQIKLIRANINKNLPYEGKYIPTNNHNPNIWYKVYLGVDGNLIAMHMDGSIEGQQWSMQIDEDTKALMSLGNTLSALENWNCLPVSWRKAPLTHE